VLYSHSVADDGRALVACADGTLPWTHPTLARRTLFYKYGPIGTSYSSSYFEGDDYEQYDELTDRMRAILMAPGVHSQKRQELAAKI
jgi:hypothetical protein